ncbi:hypothetical protein H5410_006789 [Solanum commersonii]|uniref:K Homology domain-containing protein n=1 Tax=Solanum commersonii TaxID=4109 RepID=A0A9J6ABA3_SOLCO|nr:hypothetical protein H5410_006789 [Solanum commersonii]
MAGRRDSYGKRSHSQSDYSENGGNKRRNTRNDKDPFSIGPDDTVYRYLCPVKKIGSIIGKGGEIVKQLRVDTKSKIRIGETVPDCDERVVTIYSSSEETNEFDGTEDRVCPAQDALFRVYDKIISDDTTDENSGKHLSETGAQIRILKDKHLPACALSSDELVQISGEVAVVRKALFEVATRLHNNPSRTQHILASDAPTIYSSRSSLIGSAGGAPIVGIAPLVGPYGGYKGESGDWSRSFYSAPRDESASKEFSLRLVCPTANIGGVIGKGGVIINQIRQESGAVIKVNSSNAEGDNCVISISAKEFFEDTYSPTIEAALRLQPRCREEVERDSGLISVTTRLLVPASRIGCLIGKGGSIINEMRKITKANIRILSKEDLPKVASDDDEMVQISGDPDASKDALMQVTSRLRANLFEKEGPMSAFVPVLPYLPMSTDSDTLKYEHRDTRRHGREHSYSAGYGGTSDLPHADGFGSYGTLQDNGVFGSCSALQKFWDLFVSGSFYNFLWNSSSSVGYGAYEGYSPAYPKEGYSHGRSSGSGSSRQNSAPRRKSYGY